MWRIILIILNLFNVLSCVGGFTYIVLAGAPEMPVAEMMRPGTFENLTIPGWILLVIVGGTHLIAAIALLRRTPRAALWSAISGFTMVIWIYVEVVLMTGTNWMHHLWGVLGLAEIGCTLALLGVFKAMPKPAG